LGSTGDEVTGEWKELAREELHDLYASRRIVRVITLSIKGLAGHVARVGEERGAYKVFWGETWRKETRV
jgi:hypothetical protein